jgi:hypothetical protein
MTASAVAARLPWVAEAALISAPFGVSAQIGKKLPSGATGSRNDWVAEFHPHPLPSQGACHVHVEVRISGCRRRVARNERRERC